MLMSPLCLFMSVCVMSVHRDTCSALLVVEWLSSGKAGAAIPQPGQT